MKKILKKKKKKKFYIKNIWNINIKKINQLDKNFCSLGQSINYYTNLKHFFPDNYREILIRLNDIATNNDLRKEFINCHGVKNSLLRESSAYKALEEANFYLRNKTNLNDLSFTLNYKAPYSDNETNIEFNFKKNDIFPYRINVLVGKNGTGKTYLLTRLANLLSGLTDEYEDYDTFFLGNRPAFEKIISISYSAFDSFKKKRAGESLYSYVYCGIQSEKGNLSLDNLKDNFKESLKKVKDLNRYENLKLVLNELMENENDKIIEKIDKMDLDEIKWSSGQHILISTITEILANIEEESILLFDEPEIHLHPNAIANVMRMFNKLLEIYNSYAIFATHSPIILQELLSEKIIILQRVHDILLSRKPKIECFGESISEIVSEIFNVLSSESSYKDILTSASSKMSETEILEFFQRKLGLNAKIFLKSLYKGK